MKTMFLTSTICKSLLGLSNRLMLSRRDLDERRFGLKLNGKETKWANQLEEILDKQ